LTQTLAEIESDFDSHTFYIAKINGKIAGSVNIRVDSSTGHIGRLIVSPEMQNMGIGSLLMKHVEAIHAKMEVFELFTGDKSERNLSFYYKRGYREFKPGYLLIPVIFLSY
jgi:N-acetylglutamate synthase-like GNAT family acetyltransferase